MADDKFCHEMFGGGKHKFKTKEWKERDNVITGNYIPWKCYYCVNCGYKRTYKDGVRQD